MNTKLLASLEEVIGDWSDKQCESDEWPDFYWTDNTIELMARAAAAVLDAFVAEKKYIGEES